MLGGSHAKLQWPDEAGLAMVPLLRSSHVSDECRGVAEHSLVAIHGICGLRMRKALAGQHSHEFDNYQARHGCSRPVVGGPSRRDAGANV